MGLVSFVRDWLGNPHPEPHYKLRLAGHEITPEELRAEVNEQLRQAKVRLEHLKQEVDVIGRRP